MSSVVQGLHLKAQVLQAVCALTLSVFSLMLFINNYKLFVILSFCFYYDIKGMTMNVHSGSGEKGVGRQAGWRGQMGRADKAGRQVAQAGR